MSKETAWNWPVYSLRKKHRGSTMFNLPVSKTRTKFNLNSVMLAWCMAASLPLTTAHAQEKSNTDSTQEQDIEVIEVTGILSSLKKSLTQKKIADQIKDVISAEDIGKLPDQNLAEALQRMTGVQITRDFGSGQGVAIRGMTQNRVEINGQSTMGSDADSRSINFSELAPDAFKSMEVIKSPTASMTEGSLGGTINLSTRRAFDSKGNVLSGRLQTQHTENADSTDPKVSLFGSTRWDTSLGEMGFTTSLNYQEKTVDKDTSQVRWKQFSNRKVFDASGEEISGAGDSLYAPQRIAFQAYRMDQTKKGIVSGFQWQISDDLDLFVDGNYNEVTTDIASDTLANTFNNKNTSYQEGVISDKGSLLQGLASTGYATTNGWAQDNVAETFGFTVGANYYHNEWAINPRLSTSRGNKEINNSFFGTAITSQPQVQFSILGTDVPVMSFWKNDSVINTSVIDDYKINGLVLQDGKQETENTEFTLDFEYSMGGEHLSSIQFGTRFARREASRIRDVYNSSGQLRGELVSNHPAIVDMMVPFPEDFLDGFSGGKYDVLTPSNGNFWSNPDALEDLFNIDINEDLSEEIGRTLNVVEDTAAAYVQVNFDGELFDLPYRANVGTRLVNTETESGGWQEEPGQPNVWLVQTNSYLDALGSANIQLVLQDDMLLRLAVADVMSRPNIVDLSSATRINLGDSTGKSGNPDLEPFRARQYDVSFEWYGSETDYFSAAVYYKDIETFIVSSSEQRLLVPYGSTPDEARIFDIALPANGEGGSIKGYEVAFTKTFGDFGELYNGLGLTVNYTYADSDTPNKNIETQESLPIEGLSEHSANFIAFYEYESFSTRLAYNWRSEFLDATQGFNQQPQTQRDRGQLDFSIGYEITKKIKLSFDAINLTDTAKDQYSVYEEREFLLTDVGRQYAVALNVRF